MVRSNEQHRRTSPLQVKRAAGISLRGCATALLLVWLAGTSHALIVGPTPNVIPATATAPADDFGFLNAVQTGNFAGGVCVSNCLNGVYLGDGWILSAKHTGVGGVKFDHIATPFTAIPNQAFLVSNPTGLGLTEGTDLRLYRIKGDT